MNYKQHLFLIVPPLLALLLGTAVFYGGAYLMGISVVPYASPLMVLPTIIGIVTSYKKKRARKISYQE